MAAASFAAPGTQYGPCAGPCQHTDCAATRRTAESKCRICGQAIGYEMPFYGEGDGDPRTYVHRVCLYDEIALRPHIIGISEAEGPSGEAHR